jgi:mannose/fructose/N-acetylgalactosamine-specific phosphotransferase system component IIC
MNRYPGSDMNSKRRRITSAGRIAVLGALVWMVASAATAYAQDVAGPHASEIDHSTREWLALQRDNRVAAPTQPVLGDVASLVYQRYLDSFKNKIPDTMGSQLGTGAGMSGGGQSTQ